MIKVGSSVNLIKDVVLTGTGEKNIVVDKKNPCKGVIISMERKTIAGNRIKMCRFRPDKVSDGEWEFGLKAFVEIKGAE